MTFWILLAIAAFLTFLSLKHYNLLFSLGGSLGWLTLWMYNLNYPPTNITIGSTLHEFLIYTFIIMAIATILIYFRSGRRVAQERGGVEDGDSSGGRPYGGRGLMNLTEDEYRSKVRRATRKSRR